MRVLVVEDSPRLAASLKKGLGEEGFTIDIAHDGPGGLHAARTGDYDLVLLDVNLPGMDGMAVVRDLRRSRSDVVGVMHIRNTLQIGEIEISASLLDRARELPHLDVDRDGHELAFDASGRIVEVWGSATGHH